MRIHLQSVIIFKRSRDPCKSFGESCVLFYYFLCSLFSVGVLFVITSFDYTRIIISLPCSHVAKGRRKVTCIFFSCSLSILTLFLTTFSFFLLLSCVTGCQWMVLSYFFLWPSFSHEGKITICSNHCRVILDQSKIMMK